MFYYSTMQKLRPNIFLAPLVPSFLMATLVGINTSHLEMAMHIKAIAVGFVVWALAGEVSLLLFGIPLLLIFIKAGKINLFISALVGTASSVFMTALITYLIQGRVTWHEALINVSHVSVPSGVVAGIALWFLCFKNQKT